MTISQHLRCIAHRAARAWIATIGAIRGTAREVWRTILALVDNHTGASHPRFPITIERIANEVGRDESTVCRVLNRLESLGLVVRHRARVRLVNGHWRQLPTTYELVLPESCWRNLTPVAQSHAARELATYAPRIDDAPTFEDSFEGELSDDDEHIELSVRGTAKVPNDKPGSWDVAGFDDRTIPGDEVSAEDLARQIVDAGSLALARVSDDRKFVAMNGINELRQRAREVALTICQHGLTAARGCGVVRQWVDSALGNAHQAIHSAAHALNILRKFIVGAANESKRAHDAARERGRVRHYQQFDEPSAEYGSSGIRINRV